MKILTFSLLLMTFSAMAEPIMTNCYQYWNEDASEPAAVLQYQIIRDEHGWAEAYDCQNDPSNCKLIGELKPHSRNTDFSSCLVSKKGKAFAICHGDYIPSRETSLGTLITLQIATKGKPLTDFLCDESFLAK